MSRELGILYNIIQLLYNIQLYIIAIRSKLFGMLKFGTPECNGT